MKSGGDIVLVFTDLEGSSALSARLGVTFEPWRDAHFALLRESLVKYNGLEIETAGDSLFAAFEEAEDAARFALDAQLAILRFAWPEEVGALKVRIGAHRGNPHRGNDLGRLTLRGAATNWAARVMGAGHGGQIVFSSAARHDVTQPIDVEGCSEWISHGVHRLKGVGEDELWGLVHPLLRRDFPPLETLDPIRHNLPPITTPVFGRERQLGEWRNLLLGSTRLLTLCAFGGLGKTRAALALAESLVGDFADGVWWVDAANARSKEELWRAIALALSLEITPALSLENVVCEFLENKRLLLCLDNLEQIADADQVVTQVLERTRRVSVLATSRHALRLRVERLVFVPPLDESEGAILFAERALVAGAVVDAHSSEVRSLVRKLEGIPLAIILAAARTRLLHPAEIEARLGDRFRVLGSKSSDMPARQQTLMALIDWSFELLQPLEADVLARLSVWAGGTTLSAFEALEEEVGDSWESLETLEELVARSLVLRDSQSGRLSLFDSVAFYAAQKLAARESSAGETAWRHARYFAAWSGRKIAALRTPDEVSALRELSAETANLERALDVALTYATPEAMETAALLALYLGITHARHGLAREAVVVFDRALSRQTAPTTEAMLRRERAGALLDDKQWEEARREALAALKLAQDEADVQEEVRVRTVLGLVSMESGASEEAEREFKTAVALAESQSNRQGTAIARHNLGTLAFNAGHFEEAEEFWAAALEWRRVQGDQRGLAETLCNLGVLAQEQGHLEDATRFANEALDYEIALEHLTGTARILFNLGELAEISGDFLRAARFYAASARAFERAGSSLLPLVREAHGRASSHIDEQIVAPDVVLPELVAWARQI